MKNESRRHHYISQFYLKGFSKKGLKNPLITVINKNEKSQFKTTSKNLACIYDFNRVNIKGLQPDVFEKEIAKFESKAAHAIKALHTNMRFEGENRSYILELIAMFATRNPSIRNNIARFFSHANKAAILTLLRNNPEMRDGILFLIKKIKPEEKITIPDEEIKKFVEEDLTIKINTAYHLQTELIMIGSILNLLSKRKWTLLQSPGDSNPFITSDTPTVLCWENPEQVPAIHRHHPGFGMPKTVVYFPLSSNLSLIGKFDGGDITAPPNEKLVAISNSMQIIHSQNQLFMPHIDFDFLAANETIQKGRRLLE